jgi:hypothetical protein
MRVSSPPVGTISTASDITDTPHPNSKPQNRSAAAHGPAHRRAAAVRPLPAVLDSRDNQVGEAPLPRRRLSHEPRQPWEDVVGRRCSGRRNN